LRFAALCLKIADSSELAMNSEQIQAFIRTSVASANIRHVRAASSPVEVLLKI
jgi:hypothetical protein